MAKRRPRLVPKVVFRVALGTTVVPLLTGCPPRHLTVANEGYGVAQVGYGPVAQRAYEPDGEASPPQLTVAAPAYANPPPSDASSDATVEAKVEAGAVDAGRADAARLDAGKRDAAVAGPSLTARPPIPGVAARGYEVEGVAYRGYDLPKAGSGGTGPGKPPAKP